MGLKKFVNRLDSWVNSTTGLGTTRDKVTLSEFLPTARLPDETADALFADNDAAYVLCTTFPEYAIQKGVGVTIKKIAADFDTADIDEKEQAEKDMRDEFERLGAVVVMFKAASWASAFGGAVVLIGADDGAPFLSMPLNENSLKRINFLRPYDRRSVTVRSVYEDIKSEKYGEPEMYSISTWNGPAIDVHESRVLRFEGNLVTTTTRRIDNNFWPDSMLQRAHKVLRSYGVSWDTLEHLIQDAGQAVFKMDDLIESIRADEEDLIDKRMALMDTMRSVIRAVVLDADKESFERHDFNFGGIGAPFELLMDGLSMTSRIPVTVLMGRSPAGENATGESDLEIFFSRVEIYRNLQVSPQVRKLCKLIFLATDGPFSGEPENWDLAYGELRTPTPQAKAQIDNTKANTYKTLIDAGVLSPEEVALSAYGPDSESEITIDVEARITSMKEPPDEPPNIEEMGLGAGSENPLEEGGGTELPRKPE